MFPFPPGIDSAWTIRFERGNLSETSKVRQVNLTQLISIIQAILIVCPQTFTPWSSGHCVVALPVHSHTPAQRHCCRVLSRGCTLAFLSHRVCRFGFCFALWRMFELLSASLCPGMPNKETPVNTSTGTPALGEGWGEGGEMLPSLFQHSVPKAAAGATSMPGPRQGMLARSPLTWGDGKEGRSVSGRAASPPSLPQVGLLQPHGHRLQGPRCRAGHHVQPGAAGPERQSLGGQRHAGAVRGTSRTRLQHAKALVMGVGLVGPALFLVDAFWGVTAARCAGCCSAPAAPRRSP